MSELILSVLLEVTVLIVIVLKIFALYRNMRIEQHLDKHLMKTDVLIKELDKHLESLEDMYEQPQDPGNNDK
jgi:hypothetical protein